GGDKGVTPAGECRRCHAERPRNLFQVLAPEQAQHRRRLPLTRHPPAAPGRRCARLVRSLRAARPPSNGRVLVHDPPLSRKSSACEVAQSTVGRGRRHLTGRPTTENHQRFLSWSRSLLLRVSPLPSLWSLGSLDSAPIMDACASAIRCPRRRARL